MSSQCPRSVFMFYRLSYNRLRICPETVKAHRFRSVELSGQSTVVCACFTYFADTGCRNLEVDQPSADRANWQEERRIPAGWMTRTESSLGLSGERHRLRTLCRTCYLFTKLHTTSLLRILCSGVFSFPDDTRFRNCLAVKFSANMIRAVSHLVGDGQP